MTEKPDATTRNSREVRPGRSPGGFNAGSELRT